MIRRVQILPGRYHDSVVLMQVSRTLAALPGVDAASVSMGTPLNLDLLPGMGFEPVSASPNDLVIAIAARDDAALAAARDALDAP